MNNNQIKGSEKNITGTRLSIPPTKPEFSINIQAFSHPIWSTASLGDNANTVLLESRSLKEHLTSCGREHVGLLALQGLARELQGFITSRFLSTVTVLALLIFVVSQVL